MRRLPIPRGNTCKRPRGKTLPCVSRFLPHPRRQQSTWQPYAHQDICEGYCVHKREVNCGIHECVYAQSKILTNTDTQKHTDTHTHLRMPAAGAVIPSVLVLNATLKHSDADDGVPSSGILYIIVKPSQVNACVMNSVNSLYCSMRHIFGTWEESQVK